MVSIQDDTVATAPGTASATLKNYQYLDASVQELLTSDAPVMGQVITFHSGTTGADVIGADDLKSAIWQGWSVDEEGRAVDASGRAYTIATETTADLMRDLQRAQAAGDTTSSYTSSVGGLPAEAASAAPAGSLAAVAINFGSALPSTTAAGGVAFDVDGSGQTSSIGWVPDTDGLLVIDPLDIPVTGSSGIVHAMSDLSVYDTDGDGMLSAAEADRAGIKVWQATGSTQSADQFKSFTQCGIAGIALDGDDDVGSDHGNVTLSSYAVSSTSGATIAATDVILQSAAEAASGVAVGDGDGTVSIAGDGSITMTIDRPGTYDRFQSGETVDDSAGGSILDVANTSNLNLRMGPNSYVSNIDSGTITLIGQGQVICLGKEYFDDGLMPQIVGNDLVIGGVDGSIITIKNAMDAENNHEHPQVTFRFQSGTEDSLGNIMSKAVTSALTERMAAEASQEYLQGSTYVLTGGNSSIIGTGHADVFSNAGQAGNVVISDDWSKNVTINADGINAADVKLQKTATDAIVTYGTTSITLKDFMLTDLPGGTIFNFSGTSINGMQIQKALADAATLTDAAGPNLPAAQASGSPPATTPAQAPAAAATDAGMDPTTGSLAASPAAVTFVAPDAPSTETASAGITFTGSGAATAETAPLITFSAAATPAPTATVASDLAPAALPVPSYAVGAPVPTTTQSNDATDASIGAPLPLTTGSLPQPTTVSALGSLDAAAGSGTAAPLATAAAAPTAGAPIALTVTPTAIYTPLTAPTPQASVAALPSAADPSETSTLSIQAFTYTDTNTTSTYGSTQTAIPTSIATLASTIAGNYSGIAPYAATALDTTISPTLVAPTPVIQPQPFVFS